MNLWNKWVPFVGLWALIAFSEQVVAQQVVAPIASWSNHCNVAGDYDSGQDVCDARASALRFSHMTYVPDSTLLPKADGYCRHDANGNKYAYPYYGYYCPDGFSIRGQTSRQDCYSKTHGYHYQGSNLSCVRTDRDPGKNAGRCSNCVGNPINPGTGNKYQIERDFIAPGDFPLIFERAYNSHPGDDSTKYIAPGLSVTAYRTLGQKWRHSYDRSISLTQTASLATAAAFRSDGKVYLFNIVGANGVPEADVTDRLQKLTDSSGALTGWLYTSSDDSVELYDATGKLLSITSRSGISQVLTYSSALPNLLIEVMDSFGRKLAFSYDGWGRIAAMTDPQGGDYQYTYDSKHNLSSVTYPDGSARTYVFENSSFPTHLTGIIDETGNRFATYGYDSEGLASSSQHANGADRVSLNNTSRKVTDALGAVRDYTFQTIFGVAKATKVTQPIIGGTGSVASTTSYDANGNVSKRIDFNGNVTTYQHNLARNLETSRTEAFGTAQARTIATQYHPTFRLPTQIDEPGRRTTLNYDPQGNLVSRAVLDTSTGQIRATTFTRSIFGQLLTVDGPRADVSDLTTYTYYDCETGFECGQIATIKNAQNQTTTFNAYNAHGQPLTITDPNGLVTTLTYDLRQRLTSRTVGTETTSFDYWPTGLLRKTTLPDGSFIAYTYDAAHRLTLVADDEGNRVAYTLDAMGNRLREDVYDPASTLTNARSRVFNTLNRLSQEIGAANTAAVTTTLGYDSQGNATSMGSPLGRNTAQAYDSLNRLTRVTDPASGVTQYAYNTLDQLISVTDPRSKVTSYTYNAFDDLTQLVSPDTGTTTSTYDSAGNLKTKTDARGALVTYSYDALNRATQAVWSDQTIQYTYDQGANGRGRLSSVSDNSGQTSWTYDSQGRSVSRQQVMGSVSLGASVSYDSAGRPSIVSYPSGHYIQYGYANGKVASITLDGSASVLTGVLYEPFGPVSGWTWGNNTLAVHGRDLDGKIDYIDSAGLRTYNYDDAFRITDITDASNSSLSQSYSYDLLDRLTGATGSTLNQSWTYDPSGNRLTQGGSSSSTYSIASSSNRLTSVMGALTRSYTYDSAGNTLSDGTTNFTYDQAGRMVSASKAGITAAYSLSALGQRVRKTVAGVSTYFFYDESGRLMGEYDSGGALIQEIVWLGDTPVASVRPNAGGSGVGVFYIHTDHLGAPTKLTRPSDNAIVWRWDHDPFGNGAPEEDPDGNSQLVQFNLRFPGQYFDAETGLNYNYFRDYDAQTGRYVESDPIGLNGGSYSTYVYVNDNPLSHQDPLGLAQYFGFPPDKEALMKAAVEEAKRKIRACKAQTNCFEDNGRERIITNLDTTTYTYNPRFLGCGFSNTGINQNGNKTIIGPASFNFGACCDLSSTLAHEANHLVGSSGRSEDSSQELERLCFNCPRVKR